MQHQDGAEEVVLARGQLHLGVVDLDHATDEIDREAVDAEDGALARAASWWRRAARRRARSSPCRRAWSRSRRAEVEGLDLAALVVPARQHHNRQARMAHADRPEQVVPAHVGQAEVEEDEVRAFADRSSRAVGAFGASRMA